jgi:hypothetical protein
MVRLPASRLAFAETLKSLMDAEPSLVLKTAWIAALRHNLDLLRAVQSGDQEDRIVFVILWSCALGKARIIPSY